MSRYPPSTIHRNLDLLSPQRIQNLNTDRHNTSPPSQTLNQATHPLPLNTTQSTTAQTQTHVQHSPCSYRIGKAQIYSSHPNHPHNSYTAPSQTHIHFTNSTYTSHPCTTRISSTSSAVDTKPEPHVSPRTSRTSCTSRTYRTSCTSCARIPHTPHSPQPHLPVTSHQHFPCHRTLTLSQHTHMQHKQKTPHQHRVPIQPHRQTNDDNLTTDTTYPAVKVRYISSYCRST